jgi:hypothetical protein
LPVVLGMAWLLVCAGTAHADRHDAEPELSVGRPYVQEGTVCLDFSFSGIFAGEVLDALHSGLAATLVVEWRMWRQREGWWDSSVDDGATFFRVYFDILQQRYDVFNRHGRRIASEQDLAGVERAICQPGGLTLCPAVRLLAGRRYYVEVLVRIKPLDEDEIRDLENWLSGRPGGRDGILKIVSRRTQDLLKSVVGPNERSAWERTEVFWGRELGKSPGESGE